MVTPVEIWEKAALERSRRTENRDPEEPDGWGIWAQVKEDEKVVKFSRLQEAHKVWKEKLPIKAGQSLLVLAPPLTGYFLALQTKYATPIIAKTSRNLFSCFFIGTFVPFAFAANDTLSTTHLKLLSQNPNTIEILGEQFLNNVAYGMALPLMGLPMIVLSVARKQNLTPSSGSQLKDIMSAYSMTAKPLARKYALPLIFINAAAAYIGVSLKLWGIDRIISSIDDDREYSRSVMATPTWLESFYNKYLAYGFWN